MAEPAIYGGMGQTDIFGLSNVAEPLLVQDDYETEVAARADKLFTFEYMEGNDYTVNDDGSMGIKIANVEDSLALARFKSIAIPFSASSGGVAKTEYKLEGNKTIGGSAASGKNVIGVAYIGESEDGLYVKVVITPGKMKYTGFKTKPGEATKPLYEVVPDALKGELTVASAIFDLATLPGTGTTVKDYTKDDAGQAIVLPKGFKGGEFWVKKSA